MSSLPGFSGTVSVNAAGAGTGGNNDGDEATPGPSGSCTTAGRGARTRRKRKSVARKKTNNHSEEETDQPQPTKASKIVPAAAAVGDAVETDELPERFLKVFGNDLIFRKVTSYLNFPDLLKLRAACTFVSRELQGIPEFLGRCKFVVGEEVSAKTLLNSYVNWKHIVLDLDLDEQLKNGVLAGTKQVLSHADSLEVRRKDPMPFLLPNRDQAAKAILFSKQFEEIISSVQAIHSLDMDWKVIGTEIQQFSQNVSEIPQALRSVSKLHISSNTKSCNRSTFRWCLKTEAMEKNLKFWLNHYIKLTALIFDMYPPFTFGSSPNDQFRETIINLIKQHQSTLEHIRLNSKLFKPSQLSHFQVVIPNLSKLEISHRSRDWDAIKSFIEAQPLLQFLKITLSKPIELAIFQAISERSSRFKSINIKFKRFNGWNKYLLDWTFLENLTSLEEFRLCVNLPGYTDNIHATDILRLLPSSMKKVYLYGLSAGYGNNEDLVTESLVSSLGRMTNLTELSFLSSEYLVTDGLLQFIYSSITGLRVLEFGRSHRVTRFGINGMSRNGIQQGLGLSSLKRLNRLRIGSSPDPWLVVADLVEAIKFLELSQLEVDPCDFPHRRNMYFELQAVHEDLALKLARNNPSLQVLICDWNFIGKRGNRPLRLDMVERDIKQILPGFKSLQSKLPITVGRWTVVCSDTSETTESSSDSDFVLEPFEPFHNHNNAGLHPSDSATSSLSSSDGDGTSSDSSSD